MKSILTLLLLASCTAFAATEQQINTNFNVAPGGALVVDVGVGSITVTANDRNEVAVDVWRKATRRQKAKEEEYLQNNPVILEQRGNTVTVRCTHHERNRLFRNARGNRNQASYTIRVPSQFNARLDTAGGGIDVSDLTGEVQVNTSGGGLKLSRIQGPLDGNTSGGGIDVTECQGDIEINTSGGGINVVGGSGSLDGRTSGGPVTVRNFQGNTHVRTSGGGIRIEHVVGEISGRTSGGGVTAVFSDPIQQPIDLSTSGGGVTVRLPASAAFELDAQTSGGGASCELPVTVVGEMKPGHLKGAVNGGGPILRLRSSGGGIHVKKL